MNAVARSDRAATSLGWLGLGLGAVQLLAPALVASLVGAPRTRSSQRLIRLLGAREALSGLGLIGGQNRKAWFMARVAGKVVDAALLTNAVYLRRRWSEGPPSRSGLALACIVGLGALDLCARRLTVRTNLKALPPVAPAAIAARHLTSGVLPL